MSNFFVTFDFTAVVVLDSIYSDILLYIYLFCTELATFTYFWGEFLGQFWGDVIEFLSQFWDDVIAFLG